MAAANKIKRLFYDIETSPNLGLFWSSSYKTSISPNQIIKERAVICICWKWQGQKSVHSLRWDKNQCDRVMLEKFRDILLSADEIVAHNGDRFDEKWLRTRYLFHGIPVPPKFNSLDTLKKARTHFKFNSNRLDYIGQYLFGEGKISTNYQLWKDIAMKNCRASMKLMVDYCKQDVLLLEKVYLKIEPFIKHNTHMACQYGGEKYECPKCGSPNQRFVNVRYTAAGTKRIQFQCKSCHSYHTMSNKTYMDKHKDEMTAKHLQ